MPPRRAAQLVAAATAARLRAGLLDAVAALRRGDSLEATRFLLALGAALRALPLPGAAAELDLVATALSQRSTGAERSALLGLYLDAHGRDEGATAVAAALGEPAP